MRIFRLHALNVTANFSNERSHRAAARKETRAGENDEEEEEKWGEDTERGLGCAYIISDSTFESAGYSIVVSGEIDREGERERERKQERIPG